MDSLATLDTALNALADVTAALEDYATWLKRGGFAPDGATAMLADIERGLLRGATSIDQTRNADQ